MIAKLPKEPAEHIQRLVDSGDYDNSTDVVVKAVDELTSRDTKLERLRALIQEGIDSIEEGHVRE